MEVNLLMIVMMTKVAEIQNMMTIDPGLSFPEDSCPLDIGAEVSLLPCVGLSTLLI